MKRDWNKPPYTAAALQTKLGEYRAISFDPTYEKLTLNVARIIKADGTIVLIEPKHVQLRDVATDFQVYDQDKQLVGETAVKAT